MSIQELLNISAIDWEEIENFGLVGKGCAENHRFVIVYEPRTMETIKNQKRWEPEKKSIPKRNMRSLTNRCLCYGIWTSKENVWIFHSN